MIDKDIKNILKTELAHYNDYQMKLSAFRARERMLGLENAVVSEYIYRIERFCMAVDFVFTQLNPIKERLVREVYIHRVHTIKRFAVMNYMDLSSAYRWANEFFTLLALELGYLDRRCASLPEPDGAYNS